MREIKFRGKRIDNNKWVYGYYFHLYNYKMNDGSPERNIHGIFNDSGLVNPVDWEGTIHRASYVEVIPGTVGQFTGLKDKNGKPIYEGDITKDFNGCVPIIVFDTSRACFRAEEKVGFSEFISDGCEIIGNLTDNPELLKMEGDGG